MRVCSVCGLEPDCTVAAFTDHPFVDGRKHEALCHRCFCVLKNWEYDDSADRVICYKNLSPYYLNDINTMTRYGFDATESEISIRAMIRLVSKAIQVTPFGHSHIIEILFLGNEVEILNWPNEAKLSIT